MKRILLVIPKDYSNDGVQVFFRAVYGNYNEDYVDVSLLNVESFIWGINDSMFNGSGINCIEGHAQSSNKMVHFLKYRSILKRTMREQRFDAVHVKSGKTWFLALTIIEAKRAGIPVRIAHASNMTPRSALLKLCNKKLQAIIRDRATDLVACSNMAGSYMFGKSAWKHQGRVIVNGVNTARFAFSSDKRMRYRGDVNGAIIGHVGRFGRSKNHQLLIEVFSTYAQMDKHAVLWLIGDGSERPVIENTVQELNLSSRVVFWGVTDKVPELMQAMDVFVFPSRYEGLGIAVLEAEAAGLPCVISRKVPKEVIVPGCMVEQLSLDDSPEEWAKVIAALAELPQDRKAAVSFVEEAGFTWKTARHEMWRVYEKYWDIPFFLSDDD